MLAGPTRTKKPRQWTISQDPVQKASRPYAGTARVPDSIDPCDTEDSITATVIASDSVPRLQSMPGTNVSMKEHGEARIQEILEGNLGTGQPPDLGLFPASAS